MTLAPSDIALPAAGLVAGAVALLWPRRSATPLDQPSAFDAGGRPRRRPAWRRSVWSLALIFLSFGGYPLLTHYVLPVHQYTKIVHGFTAPVSGAFGSIDTVKEQDTWVWPSLTSGIATGVIQPPQLTIKMYLHDGSTRQMGVDMPGLAFRYRAADGMMKESATPLGVGDLESWMAAGGVAANPQALEPEARQILRYVEAAAKPVQHAGAAPRALARPGPATVPQTRPAATSASAAATGPAAGFGNDEITSQWRELPQKWQPVGVGVTAVIIWMAGITWLRAKDSRAIQPPKTGGRTNTGG